jgi:outer membrane biosynthesis protein TonB
MFKPMLFIVAASLSVSLWLHYIVGAIVLPSFIELILNFIGYAVLINLCVYIPMGVLIYYMISKLYRILYPQERNVDSQILFMPLKMILIWISIESAIAKFKSHTINEQSDDTYGPESDFVSVFIKLLSNDKSTMNNKNVNFEKMKDNKTETKNEKMKDEKTEKVKDEKTTKDKVKDNKTEKDKVKDNTVNETEKEEKLNGDEHVKRIQDTIEVLQRRLELMQREVVRIKGIRFGEDSNVKTDDVKTEDIEINDVKTEDIETMNEIDDAEIDDKEDIKLSLQTLKEELKDELRKMRDAIHNNRGMNMFPGY